MLNVKLLPRPSAERQLVAWTYDITGISIRRNVIDWEIQLPNGHWAKLHVSHNVPKLGTMFRAMEAVLEWNGYSFPVRQA